MESRQPDATELYRIAYLLAGHVRNTLKTEERTELSEWRKASPDNEAIFVALTDKNSLKKGLAQRQMSEDAVKAYLDRSKQPHIGRKVKIIVVLAAAAALALFLFLFLPGSDDHQPSTVDRFATTDIQPGHAEAVLTMGNGESMILSETTPDTMLQQVVTIKGRENSLYYSPSSIIETHELAIPRGGFYSLVLPDGSKVWLNSESSLRYPTSFTGGERRVELRGEAYFAIVHNDAAPFRVHVQRNIVEDLGTAFNIKAYPDEGVLTTTLVEGLARVITPNNTKDIRPNEQAVVQGKTIQVKKVDAAESTAWVNGQFDFNDTPLEDILRQLARWYDAEIIYKDPPKNLELTAEISKFTPVSKVLYLLAKTDEVSFQIEGKKITVSR